MLNIKIKYAADFMINKQHERNNTSIHTDTVIFGQLSPEKTQLGKTSEADMRVSLFCRNSEYKCVIVIINQSLEEI